MYRRPKNGLDSQWWDIFCFFLHDEEFVSKTINEGNVDLDKFPTSKGRKLAKRMESSKATACYIRQVAGDPQAAQINLLRHQCTELSAGKYKKKTSSIKSSQSNYENPGNENLQVSSQHKKQFDAKNAHHNKERCSRCGDSTYVKGFQCPAKKFQCKACHKFGHFTRVCYQKKQVPFKSRKAKVHQLQAGAVYAKKVPNAVNLKITAQVRIHFACRSKCSAHKLIFRRFPGKPTW